MSSTSSRRRHRSVSPTSRYPPDEDYYEDYEDYEDYKDYEGRTDRRHHHNGHHKHRHSRDPFAMDLLRTAVTTLGEAVVNGREDGHHHHHKQHYDDYDPRSIKTMGNKTTDQVFETLVQAAYTLGEVVGEFERKLGINHDAEGKSGSERKSKHRGVEDGYYNQYPRADSVDSNGYSGTGTPVPPPPSPWTPGYADEYYDSPQRTRPYPLRRASSNPEFESPYHQYHADDNQRSSRNRTSASSTTSSKHSKHRHRSRSPSASGVKDNRRSRKEAILHQLPLLITRAAFLVELLELKNKHRERSGMAAKYAALLMALRIVKQLRKEYSLISDKRGKK